MIIYLTTNNLNGKIYIGKHCGKQDSYLGSGVYVRRSIKKYGKKNFSRITLEDGITDHNYLCEREIYWIKFYDSTNPLIGYNLTDGGEGMPGFHHTEETRKNMSEVKKGEKNPNYGKHQLEETCKKMSENHVDFSGENNPMYEKKHSPETIEKMSGENHPMYGKKGKDNPKIIKKEIVLGILKLLNKGLSVIEISKKIDVSKSTIYKIKNGWYNDIYGL